ncbi:flavodoxin family protein [Alkaliphilus serpentinus]|uniref:Flavodoxin n=1 Tax=Alkaliphilus serpentinus TaxID=1482731 RepID=A0A833HLR4_9FIRM|nr:flavodoxin [Alkaliphilus serpentinus]KAB3526361.1 flavodoxin [Alkaliphilus serpentinus]
MEEKNIKKLVIYYSFEGNTKLVAEAMAEAIGADLLQLRPKKELKSTGFSKYLWGGSQVVMKKKPELLPFEVNPRDYDLILIGTPVWAWTYTPPIATLLSTVDFSGKTIGLFSTHGGQNAKTLINMRNQLKNSNIAGEIDFFEPLTKDTGNAIKRAKEWASSL